MAIRSLAFVAVVLAIALNVSAEPLSTEYHPILVAGQQVQGKVFGQQTDARGRPIYATSFLSEDTGSVSPSLEVSNAQDFTALLEVGSEIYMTVHTEFYPPSNIFIVKMKQDRATGALSAAGPMTTASFKQWGGLWLACSGHLSKLSRGKKTLITGSEEYEPNARHFALATNMTDLKTKLKSDLNSYGWADMANMMRYFGKYPFENNLNLPVLTFEDIQAQFNPYMYGYITTLDVKKTGRAKTNKLLTMGRFSHEMAYIMPDERTVYMTDDQSSGGGLFRFVAHQPGMFNKGRLYAIKVTQQPAQEAKAEDATFQVSWVLLGEATQDQLLQRVQGLKFSDIFEVATPTIAAPVVSCPPGFSSINTATGIECLKLKAGKQVEAAFFETRRYAALMGATTEFSKGEGLAYSEATGELYVAMSIIRRSMEDGKNRGSPGSNDLGGPNHIRLQYNACGCIFGLKLDSRYTATEMYAKKCGVGITSSTCEESGIAGPDNIQAIGNKLIIAEDSEFAHSKNLLWSLDLETNELTLLQKMQCTSGLPCDPTSSAEFTSPYLYNIRGRDYLITNVNNYDEQGKIKGAVGYFGPWNLKANQPFEFQPPVRK